MKIIVSLMVFALIISLSAQMFFPLAFADAPKYEKVLKVVSGSQSDLTTFTYNGHNVSKGFAVDISMMAAVEPNVWSFSKALFAVSLASAWSETPYPYDVSYSYEPQVSDMWVKVQGDSNFRIETGGIADNTGTGGSCAVSWKILLDILLTILPPIIQYLAQHPPLASWQSDLHWAEAIDTSKPLYEGGHLNPTYNPCVKTAGCDFNSLFFQNGYQYLTITAGADICLVRGWWARGDYWYWESIPIGTYSVTFQVEVPVTNEPETPSTPSGPTSGYRNVEYAYFTSTTDPNGDNVRYQFEFTGPSTNVSFTTGWYASGQTGSLTVMWKTTDPLGTYQIRVRAQDIYEEWSCWSPYLTVSIVNRAPNTPSTPSGPPCGYADTSYSCSTNTTDPDGDNVRYQFDWGEGSTTTTGWYVSGSTASASHTWSSLGTYYVKGRAQDSYGAWSGWSSNLTVTISSESGDGGGGGVGCPTLFAWNGRAYVEEALLDIHALGDVTVDYRLEYLKPFGSFCMLSLRELDNYTSHIDQVKLYAVDAEGNWHECSLILALHSQLGKVTTQMLYDDNTRIDLTPKERISLLFTLPEGLSNIQYFIFELNGYNPKDRLE
jgi:hypothetical protein